MSRNIVPRIDKGADLGTEEKNWNRLYTDNIFLSGDNLKTILNNKADLALLMAKGDLYTATGPGAVTRLPRGNDGYVLKSDSSVPEGLKWRPAGARQELTDNITVTVGTAGDFPTINNALENIVALYYPKFKSTGCPRVTIRLLSGFIMSEQVLVESLDLSWITITGDDDKTLIDRSALTKYFINKFPVFAVTNGGFLPIIGQLFYTNTSGGIANRCLIATYNNSQAIILSGCGIESPIDSGAYMDYGICAENNSKIHAASAIISGRQNIGVYATNNSIINIFNANVSEAIIYGVLADYNSIVNAKNVDAHGCGGFGIRANNNSIINAIGINVSETSGTGIYANNSSINVTNANASNTGSHAIYSENGSTINAVGINASGTSNYGAYIINSMANLNGATFSGRIHGVYVKDGSVVNAKSVIANETQYEGIYILNGSIVSAHGTTCTSNLTPNTITSNGILIR